MAPAVAVEQKRSTGFKIGWWVLVVVTASSLAGHALLPLFTTGEEVLFVGWTTMNLYALVVLLTAYKGGEVWGWWVTWLMPTSYASLILFDSELGPAYLGAGVLMAAAQLVTRPAFR
jgi:hypothetical protein